jgi:hypothetical protein
VKQADRQRFVNVALAAVAAVLVALVVATAGSVTTSEREAREFNLLAAWRDEEVRSLTITRGQDVIRIERIIDESGSEGPGVWRIKTPYDEDADVFGMERYLGTLQFASWQRRISRKRWTGWRSGSTRRAW